jgi:predicted peroxiredoxin
MQAHSIDQESIVEGAEVAGAAALVSLAEEATSTFNY